MSSDILVRRILKPAVFLAAFAPCSWLLWAAGTGTLGADPLREITNETGIWSLRFLCLTLIATPVRRITGWNAVIRFRRMLGLYAFFYGTLHLLTYLIADRFASLDFPDSMTAWEATRIFGISVATDILKRPFITVGFSGWLCMVPLAVTSTSRMIRVLGGRRWQTLHRLTYGVAIAGVVHYWWLVKADIRRPAMYAVFVSSLLAARLWRLRPRKSRASAPLAA